MMEFPIILCAGSCGRTYGLCTHKKRPFLSKGLKPLTNPVAYFQPFLATSSAGDAFHPPAVERWWMKENRMSVRRPERTQNFRRAKFRLMRL
jgi:hypothetical protein